MADRADLANMQTSNDYGNILLQASWVSTIESAETEDAFITKSPEEIYKPNKTSVMTR